MVPYLRDRLSVGLKNRAQERTLCFSTQWFYPPSLSYVIEHLEVLGRGFGDRFILSKRNRRENPALLNH